MPSYLPHVASRVFGAPLLIQPRKLDVILRVLGPRIGIANNSAALDLPVADENDEEDTEVKPYVVTPEGIAIIGIDGSLVRKSSFLSAVSGMTSYAVVEDMFIDAVTDSSVKAILLNMDSPGGEAGGTFDLSDQIYSQRGQKPIYAIANESMYSAAYAIGSAADKVFITRTGGVGSIGVICLHVDQSAMDKQEGLAYTAIYAGDHKNDFTPHEPLTDQGRSEMQAEVDRLYGLFVETVARNRGLSTKAVRETKAGLYGGSDGVTAGLADQVGTVADALKALTAALPAAQTGPQRIFPVAGTSVAANSNNREVTLVSEETIVADPIPTTSQHPNPDASAPGPNPSAQPVQPASIEVAATPSAGTIVLQASSYGYEESLEVMELCSLAGAPLSRATEFVAQRTPADQVRRILNSERAQASTVSPIVSAVLPQTSTHVDPKLQPNGTTRNPLMAAVESIVDRQKPRTIGGRN